MNTAMMTPATLLRTMVCIADTMSVTATTPRMFSPASRQYCPSGSGSATRMPKTANANSVEAITTSEYHAASRAASTRCDA